MLIDYSMMFLMRMKDVVKLRLGPKLTNNDTMFYHILYLIKETAEVVRRSLLAIEQLKQETRVGSRKATKSSNIKLQSSFRSKSHYSMHDLDQVYRCSHQSS